MLLLQFLLSDIFPEIINHKIVKPVFAVVVTLLFVCPQVVQTGGCMPRLQLALSLLPPVSAMRVPRQWQCGCNLTR